MTTKALIEKSNLPVNRAYISALNQTHSEQVEITNHCLIGRSEDCNLKLISPFVSQRHARIINKEGRYFLQDLRSRNGTRLNGLKVIEAELSDQDRITIGDERLIFALEPAKKECRLKLQSRNSAWNEQLQRLPALANSDFSILILGPSGVGKEVLAQQIHRHSPRAQGSFVSVNCSALSPQLVESELFGHLKGSFTGADTNRKGAFESARGGTLFLDEIGDLPLDLQPKLLRALENSEVKPVGGDRSIATDVRIIAATHANLYERVLSGQFRLDLYYRLNVIELRPPPLCERLEDFEDLLYHFAKSYRVSFSHDAIQLLKKHPWEGNIRELKNTVARASTILPNRNVRLQDVTQLLHQPQHQPKLQSPSAVTSIRDMEKALIEKALLRHIGNQRRAALDLGLPKSTLNDRIKTYGIDIEKLISSHLPI